MFWQVEEIKHIHKQKKEYKNNPELVKKINSEPFLLSFMKRTHINSIYKIQFSPSHKEWQTFVNSDIKSFHKKILFINETFVFSNNTTEPQGIILTYKKNGNETNLIILNNLMIFKVINNQIFKSDKIEKINNYINTITGIKRYKSLMIEKYLNTKPNQKIPSSLGKEFFGDLHLKNLEIDFPLKRIWGDLVLTNTTLNKFDCQCDSIVYNLNDSKINYK